MTTLVTGAFGCIRAWVCKRTHAEAAIPFPSELADLGYQRDLGPAPRTCIRDGIRRTLDEFAALQRSGRLDARELGPAA